MTKATNKALKLKTLATIALGVAAFGFNATPQGQFGFAQAQAQSEGVRPEVGKILKDAGGLIKAGKYKEALSKVHEAEGVSGRNGTENYYIEATRVAAASGAGDADAMVKGFEAMKASGKLGTADQLKMMESIAGTYLRNRDNAKALSWAQRYFKEGGTSASMKQVLTSAQFQSGDMGSIIKDTQDEITADEKAGRTPSMDKLNLLLSAALKKGDSAAEGFAVERLLNYYPRKELWAQVLGGLQSKKGFSDRFNLDILRLKLATGNLKDANDYFEMAQLSAQAGYPEEGKLVVEKGMAAGILGQGAEGARHKRLLDLLNKRITDGKATLTETERAASEAKDGNAQVSLGLAYAFRGEAAKGAKIIADGIEKGSLKRPEDAKLYLGMAQSMAGDSTKAAATWRSVKGTDGSAELARLWVIQTRGAKR
ncbi:hypothetical protein [Roseateles koreensis]|uniref:TPR repeat n=1 Tax=Roseateles koreensis TaxID=2987526 RepID=A0ABT5KLT1_9BURK|nr:hypothetical protein [Roseateles koreensis]MDC8783872.1 hypothetical protein [Roseateles koreensis]